MIDGKLNQEGNYKNGELDGFWIFLSETGRVYEEICGNYKNDIKVKMFGLNILMKKLDDILHRKKT